jgi:hypothetical protein
MMMRNIVFVLSFVVSTSVFAELDPALEDVSVDTMNPEGLFIEGQLDIGQSDPAGDSSPGVAFLGGGEVGFSFASGYWQKMEVGLGLSTGSLEYKSKSGGNSANVTVDVPMAMMVRFGMGSVIGRGGIFLWNIAVGSYLTNYEQKFQGTTYKSNSASSSFAWRFGAKFMMPFSETIQFVGGLQHTQVTVNIDEVKANGQTITNADISDVVNIPQLTLGFRVTI